MNNNLTEYKTTKYRPIPSVKSIIFFSCVCVGIITIIFSDKISQRIVETATDTANTVLPSLFPFMVLSDFMVKSDLCSYLKIFPGKFLGFFAGIKDEVTCAVILGLLSGFPVGASMICEMYKGGDISKKDAEKALCVSHNTGPAFPISFIGTYLYGNTAFGVCVYFSQILSMILLSRIIFKSSKNTEMIVSQSREKVNYTAALTDAIKKSAFCCITVCASIVFWKTVCEFFTVFSPTINAVIISFFEFSSGSIAAAEIGGISGAAIIGFAVGFGGLAAMFQAASFSSDSGLSLSKAFFFKIAQGITCALFTASFYLIVE